MKYFRETPVYNERRYGKPWLAIVTSHLTKNFEWISWQGSPGKAGMFVFNAEPGTMTAEGQKDQRKNRGGVDEYRILLPNGNNIATSLLTIPEGRLLELPLEERWKAAARERLEYWLKSAQAKSTLRWDYVDKYSKLLKLPNPLMAQAANALGLITQPSPIVDNSPEPLGDLFY